MSYYWIFILIPVLLWFYSGILLVRVLGPVFDGWRNAASMKPYWNLLTLFAGPVMALIVWGYQIFDLIWLVLCKLSGTIFRKLFPPRPVQPVKKPGTDTIRLFDGSGLPVGSDDIRSTGRARNALRKLLTAALDKNYADLAMDPKPNGITIVQTEQRSKWIPFQELDTKLAAEIIQLVKMLAGMNPLDHSSVQQGSFTIRRGGISYHFSAASSGSFGGEKLKIHRKGTKAARTLQECGFTPAARKTLSSALAAGSGVILIAAKPGTGASTTFRALLSAIEPQKRASVITIEDSADAQLPEAIDRNEPGSGGGNTFAALTQEAAGKSNAILGLDRIKDGATAQLAFGAAASSLVIFTIAAGTLEQAIQQLSSWGIAPEELRSKLRLAIVQRLLRKLCKCRQKTLPAPEVLEYYEEAGFRSDKTCAPAGCKNCGQTGFFGATAVFDICGAAGVDEERGTLHLAYEGFRLASEGVTSVYEVERAILTEDEK